jgi:hypothetical protein
MNPALGAAGLATGEGLDEIDEVVGISISDGTDREHERQDRGEKQPPASACTGSTRTIHLGSPDFLAVEESWRA